MTALASELAAVAGVLGDAHLRALVAAVRTSPGYTAAAAAAARQAVPAPHHVQVDRLNRAWAESADEPGSGLALALEAVQAARRLADLPRVEVVVTGPVPPAAPVRLTSEVVRQLIDEAGQRVTLVSYAAYEVPAVIAALDRAVGHGVQVNLILESPEKLEGGGGAQAYARFRRYHWPLDRREPADAKLHGKAIIIDGRDLLLTSANLTAAGYDRNIELGVLCRGGGVAHQIQRHFDALIGAGVLARVA